MFIKSDVYNRDELESAFEAVHNKAVESTLKLLPDIIMGLIVKTKGLEKIQTDFYEKYPELASRKQDVAQAVEQLEFENPNLGIEKLLEKVPAVLKITDVDVSLVKQVTTLSEIERSVNGRI